MILFISGSYDPLNAGHVRSFAWLRERYPDCHLVVGLNTDELMAKHKPGQPFIPYDQRKEILEGLRNVDQVVAVDNPIHLDLAEQLGVDIYATVEEWVERQRATIAWVKARGGEIVIPPYFPSDGVTMSSTMIRAKIRGAK